MVFISKILQNSVEQFSPPAAAAATDCRKKPQENISLPQPFHGAAG